MHPILIQVILFFTSLSLLIVLHELGHFIPAKLFKTRVEKFYLFFDIKFSLFKKKIGDTVYGIGWLPLGGYVKISGMIDESMDKEQMEQPPQPWEFRSKPAWQRLIIMLGGVTVNFILAVVIYIGLAWAYGDTFVRMDSLKDGFSITQPEIGKKLGLKNGDNILAVDGEKIVRFRDVMMELINGNTMTIRRDGKVFEQEIPVDFINTLLEQKKMQAFLSYRSLFEFTGEVPKESHNVGIDLQKGDRPVSINGLPVHYHDMFVEVLKANKGKTATLVIDRAGEQKSMGVKINNDAKLGVIIDGLSRQKHIDQGLFEIETITYSFAEAIPAGWKQGVSKLQGYIKQIKKIFNPETGAYKGVGGFGAIGGMYPKDWDWPHFWSTTAFISIILAFMNILPIPALDGGHVMFLLYEMITGRKPSDKFMEYAQIVGFLILVSLLLLANGNDVYKWIKGM
ncbi:MAG: RIP metalloprotease RseP [Flavobacteriaceae bacterium]|nr:RIP metalloprotease RseP [Flavobacteriaceae bacterium]